MFRNFASRIAKIVSEIVLQTVPPALLGTYAASQLASVTGVSFAQSAAVVATGLFACILLSATRA